jgi:hypothetical protein
MSMHEKLSRTYPRGLPFKPPEHLAAREARLRRWSILLGIGTGAVLVAIGLVIMNRTTRKADLSPALSEPLSTHTHSERGDHMRPQISQPTPPDLPSGKWPAIAATAPVPRDGVLQVLGGLTAAHLYQSYLNIGLLADSQENDLYSAAEATELLTKITAVMDKVDEQLAELARTRLEPEDETALARTRELTALLRRQAQALRTYWATGAKEDSDRYHQTRAQAWAGINEALHASQ